MHMVNTKCHVLSKLSIKCCTAVAQEVVQVIY